MKTLSTSAVLFIVLFAFGQLQASIIIDFDNPDASGGPVKGATLDNYLAGYGITISDSTANTHGEIVDDRTITWAVRAFTDYNVFWNECTNDAYSYSLNFATPTNGLSFVRPQFVPEIAVAPWRVRSYDISGNLLDTVGEGWASYFSEAEGAPKTFTLNGSGIVKLVIDRTDYNSWAGFNRFAMDNLTLNPIPEPSTLVLLSMGVAALAFYGWRRR